MDASFFFIAFLLALLVGAFIARPFMNPASAARPTAEAEALHTEREAVLTALRDLDFDHTTGKIADADYAPQREALVARGVALLQQLEAQPAAPFTDEALETEIRAARQHIRACPQCHAPASPADKFCAKCGAALRPSA
jgi:rRNA maturation endonuclease Nob1